MSMIASELSLVAALYRKVYQKLLFSRHMKMIDGRLLVFTRINRHSCAVILSRGSRSNSERIFVQPESQRTEPRVSRSQLSWNSCFYGCRASLPAFFLLPETRSWHQDVVITRGVHFSTLLYGLHPLTHPVTLEPSLSFVVLVCCK